MNRRGFLGMLIGGIAVAAAEQVIPLARVWSFPAKIVLPKQIEIKQYSDFLNISDYIVREQIRYNALFNTRLDACTYAVFFQNSRTGKLTRTSPLLESNEVRPRQIA